jgi:hypothetical protein
VAITAEHLEDWRGKDVRDPDGESIGKLQEVLIDSGSGTPILVSVRSGLLGRHAKLIPVDGATVGPDYVRVTHPKATVESSPNAERADPPDAVELDELGKVYGLRFSERIQLETATAIEERRAAAEAARQRAEQLEAEAQERAAALEAARARSEGASSEADQARRAAEEAEEAARRARREADRHRDA